MHLLHLCNPAVCQDGHEDTAYQGDRTGWASRKTHERLSHLTSETICPQIPLLSVILLCNVTMSCSNQKCLHRKPFGIDIWGRMRNYGASTLIAPPELCNLWNVCIALAMNYGPWAHFLTHISQLYAVPKQKCSAPTCRRLGKTPPLSASRYPSQSSATEAQGINCNVSRGDAKR